MLRVLPMPTGRAVLSTLDRLQDALADGDAVLPVPTDNDAERDRLCAALRPGEPIDDDTALVVATSGSTGVPKGALLSASALQSSATATHARLGGAGSWLLALPAHHIAGLQVLLRSIAIGLEPEIIDVAAGFDPGELVDAVTRMPGPRRYTSLVPTQLIKAMDQPDAVDALRCFDAVLIGGAATPVAVRQRAESLGIKIVRTYGMSETCGGCVYDGVPLDGVRVRIDSGRVVLGGPTLANGYRNFPQHPAFAEPGWFRTDDAGELHDGVLSVLGRIDDAISTGGLTVVPSVVEAVLIQHPAVRECAVLGVPDPRLGERVVAVVVGDGAALEDLRAYVAEHLDFSAAPREVRLVEQMPLRGPGKIDRAALRELFA
ncbi:o-succinylbenzoate--CoA ligase [Skermania sp. ID1734]|uniref:o-succinylbenzoate--CoA ligase n=1 Tax=Skermania sp. ID1734 TaxID=2597516 RepID=UPI00117EB06C|nr:o-succinylbenzoate--CoA ligase [Skermania sp. ID1734]TSD95153.1 o-succinylbenzoate--CoA ligase [Skermania sp. ID1734]